ncbi:MAG: DUF4139 domain-containing protein [Candidatus Omnitrophica bacterium]|nr:DUF4139 domain-containing protein [Candidatus Omnitrophota bacterium]MCM8802262.1 DUF4139 domain-containing protein [Candidatus Omnitrophota bacterium]
MKKFFLFLFLPCILIYSRTKLVALPDREISYIRFDAPFTAFVEEERIITLQKGVNQVDFSWKGVNIDQDSITLTFLTNKNKLKLLNLSYPPEGNSLIWEIFSPEGGEEKIRISYLLSNIDCLYTYKIVVDKNEESINFSVFLIIRNFSGEDFEKGVILPEFGRTIETSTKNEETKQILIYQKDGIKFEKVFVFDSSKMIWDPETSKENVGIPVYIEIKNKKENGLGESPLIPGKTRIFQTDKTDSSIFLGEDNLKYVQVGENARLYFGDSRDIVVKKKKMKETRINVRRNNSGGIVLYDTDEIMRIEIENFRDKNAKLEILEYIPNEWDMEESTHKYEKIDANNIKFVIELKPKSKEIVEFHYHRRNLK